MRFILQEEETKRTLCTQTWSPCQDLQSTHTQLVAVVLTLCWCGGEPRRVGAVVVHHVVRADPHELVALVHAQLRHGGAIPPEALLAGTAAALLVVGRRHLAGARARVDVEAPVGGDEGRVGPVRLHQSSLSRPVVGVPDWAVDAHGLILREGDSFVF